MERSNFTDRVKKALEATYGFKLLKEVRLPNQKNFNFALGDVENKVVVDIHPESKFFEVEFVSSEKHADIQEAAAIFGNETQYFLVYEFTLGGNDKFELESQLQSGTRIRVTVLDLDDIDKPESNPEIIRKGGAKRQKRKTTTDPKFPDPYTYGGKTQTRKPSIDPEFSDPYTSGSKFNEEDTTPDPGFEPMTQPDNDAANRQMGNEHPVSGTDEQSSPQRVKKFMTSPFLQNKNFYVAATKWQGNEHAVEFAKEGFWENRSSQSLQKFINQLKTGDVVFLRGTDETGKMDHLFIKAVGIVDHNPKNGKQLAINWFLINFGLNIYALKSNPDPIATLTPTEMQTILRYFDEDKLQKIEAFLNIQSGSPVAHTIAGLISDADIGKDHLDISNDISAFAHVMAAKTFLPPLAIALFGKWGSGKSFFMRKLREQIDGLTQQSQGSHFCKGVAQVHFNAWSYMDSNLWASMVTRIFEGLQYYIDQDTSAQKMKSEVEKALTQKLNITNEALEELENKKSIVDTRLTSLKDKKAEIKIKLDNKIKEIKTASLYEALNEVDKQFRVHEKIEDALQDNESIIKNKKELKKIIPEKYWQTPEKLYEQSKSAGSFLKLFFRKDTWWKNILWVLFIIAIIVLVPIAVVYLSRFIGATYFTFPAGIWSLLTVLGALWIRGIDTYNKMQPIIASFWAIKNNYLQKKEQATIDFKQQQKAAELEMEYLRRELESLNHQITLTAKEQAELQFRLENTLSTEALYSFIERKSVSKDYAEHLGIISTIRKDFETLSELFTDHNTEIKNMDPDDGTQFNDYFEKPLERIVLYIDDLDRCPEERVVEVLEAVNLLMAYPLFVVVVGVDPRWVKNALIKRHRLQFENKAEQNGQESISPSTYLEKIFQVPFNLKSASDKNVKHMLKTLAETVPEPSDTVQSESITNNLAVSDTNKIDANPEKEKDPSTKSEAVSSTEDSETTNKKKETAPKLKIKTVPYESLVFSTEELESIQNMSIIVGPSPRAIKRFVNIFRIVKAHEDYPNNLGKNKTAAVLFLLALPIGSFKSLYGDFLAFLQNSNSSQLFESFFMETEKTGGISNLGSPKPQKLVIRHATANLLTALKKDNEKLLKTPITAFTENYRLIKRFSYVVDL